MNVIQFAPCINEYSHEHNINIPLTSIPQSSHKKYHNHPMNIRWISHKEYVIQPSQTDLKTAEVIALLAIPGIPARSARPSARRSGLRKEVIQEWAGPTSKDQVGWCWFMVFLHDFSMCLSENLGEKPKIQWTLTFFPVKTDIEGCMTWFFDWKILDPELTHRSGKKYDKTWGKCQFWEYIYIY